MKVIAAHLLQQGIHSLRVQALNKSLHRRHKVRPDSEGAERTRGAVFELVGAAHLQTDSRRDDDAIHVRNPHLAQSVNRNRTKDNRTRKRNYQSSPSDVALRSPKSSFFSSFIDISLSMGCMPLLRVTHMSKHRLAVILDFI